MPGKGKAAEEVGYDPNRSRVDQEQLEVFLGSPLTGKLTEVPNIGKGAVERLAQGDGHGHDCVTNTYQLIGKFLSLKPDEHDPVEHCNRFWRWLNDMFPKDTGVIKQQRSGIVRAIAEKVDMAYNGVYDPDIYKC